jgi:hypothetical protein
VTRRAARLRAGLAACLMILAPAWAWADTQRIVLRSGEELFGEVTATDETVDIETVSGERRRFARAEVTAIESMTGGRLGPTSPGITDAVGTAPPTAASAPPTPPSSPPAPPPEARAPRAAGPAQRTDPASAPPRPDAAPWYVRQAPSLLAIAVALVALFVAGVLRGEHRGLFGAFRRMRLLTLLGLLAVIGVYAIDLQGRREARRAWVRPLHVAVVLVERGRLPWETTQAFRARASAANEWIRAERERLRPGSGQPIWFHAFGPVSGDARPAAPEDAPTSESTFDRLVYGGRLRWHLRDVDATAGVDPDVFDARMYVYAEPPAGPRASRFVEGLGEAGGELGMVDVALDASMIDAAWVAVIHETLHTVGATDKYTPEGRSVAPEGLAEPDRTPLYPQRFAEIMSGERATGPDTGAAVSHLHEVRIGPTTAVEVGW